MIAAGFLATQGSIDPEKVLLMRFDYLLFLIDGRVALQERQERETPVAPAAAAPASRLNDWVGADGRRRVRIQTMDDLKAFASKPLG